MKRLLMALTLATTIAPVFVQAATAASPNAPYKHEDACMYRGYPCSEWTRDDRW
jgi:Spy/CpxP family protein refolding chaperone